jgi:hypothetical protein
MRLAALLALLLLAGCTTVPTVPWQWCKAEAHPPDKLVIGPHLKRSGGYWDRCTGATEF